jgi:hypothetical protein
MDQTENVNIENARLSTTHEHLNTQRDETNGRIELLYDDVAADTLLEIGTAAVTALLSVYEYLS